MSDDETLHRLRRALRELQDAERARATAWALAGSGLLDPPASRAARMEAERALEGARDALRRARAGVGAGVVGEKAWSGH